MVGIVMGKWQQISSKPSIDCNEDDLGKEGGKWNTNYGFQAKEAAAVQLVKSLGKRPVDWLKRDLLCGAARGDGRLWFLKDVLKNASRFLSQDADISFSSDKDVWSVRECRAFDYMSRHQLFRLVEELPEDAKSWKAAAAAACCPTCLYESKVCPPKHFPFLRKSQVCQCCWVCPHCYGRLVADQYTAIEKRLEESPVKYFMVLSKTQSLTKLSVEKIRQSAEKMRRNLQELALSAGAEGGIWSQQILPIQEVELNWTYRRTNAERIPALAMRVAVLATIPNAVSNLKALKQFNSRASEENLEAVIDVVPWSIGALRACLVKGRPGTKWCELLKNNSFGVFCWPPLSLLGKELWAFRFECLSGYPVFRYWGSWKKGGQKVDTQNTSLAAVLGLQKESGNVAIVQTVKQLLGDALSMVEKVPGRVVLQKLLSEKGIQISQRHGRLLAKLVRDEEGLQC